MHITGHRPDRRQSRLASLVAALPLVTVFVTLGVLKWKAHWAGLSALAVAAVVAVVAYGMPVQLAALSATQGFAFGVFPSCGSCQRDLALRAHRAQRQVR